MKLDSGLKFGLLFHNKLNCQRFLSINIFDFFLFIVQLNMHQIILDFHQYYVTGTSNMRKEIKMVFNKYVCVFSQQVAKYV